VPISPDDALRMYSAIVVRARELKFDWIVAQVEEQISLGRVAPKSLTVRGHDLFDEAFESGPNRSKRRKATFLVSQPYSEEEKLNLLLEGLTVGIVELNLIYDEVVTFATLEIKSSSVVFEPETESREGFALEPRLSLEREPSERLARLLGELKREISDAE
jgi:hypothetical protein